ncbi:MAG TPA: protein kinase [Chloroflexia bacterium]
MSGTAFKYKAGSTIGPWFLLEPLGTGGNSEVWRVTAATRTGAEQSVDPGVPEPTHEKQPPEGTESLASQSAEGASEAAEDRGGTTALKICKHKPPNKRFLRFQHEVTLHLRIGNHEGILPMLGHHLEPVTRHTPAWLAMPEAVPVKEALGENPNLEAVVEAVCHIAQTLAELAAEGIYHRDVKPGNLYAYKGGWVLGDLGLADFPEKGDLTASDERMGPLHFHAPEVLTSPRHAHPGPADVYSLAKTLYVLATEQRWPPPGPQHVGTKGETIEEYVRHARVRQLDWLIERATTSDTSARPSMSEFARELQSWLVVPGTPRPPSDIAQIIADLQIATAPHTRADRNRQHRYDLAKQVLLKFDSSVLSFLIDLQDRGLGVTSTFNPSTVAERNWNQEVSERLFNPKFGPKLYVVGAGSRTEDSSATFHYTISPDPANTMHAVRSVISITTFTDDYANLLAGHYIHARQPEFYWCGHALFPLGSAQEDHAIAELAARFMQGLAGALWRLTQLVQPEDGGELRPGTRVEGVTPGDEMPDIGNLAPRVRRIEQLREDQQAYKRNLEERLDGALAPLREAVSAALGSNGHSNRSNSLILRCGRAPRADDALEIWQAGAEVNRKSDKVEGRGMVMLHSGFGAISYDDGTLYLIAAHVVANYSLAIKDICWSDSVLISTHSPKLKQIIADFAEGLLAHFPVAADRFKSLVQDL